MQGPNARACSVSCHILALNIDKTVKPHCGQPAKQNLSTSVIPSNSGNNLVSIVPRNRSYMSLTTIFASGLGFGTTPKRQHVCSPTDSTRPGAALPKPGTEHSAARSGIARRVSFQHTNPHTIVFCLMELQSLIHALLIQVIDESQTFMSSLVLALLMVRH